ncbi:hypothetical protein E0W68_07110 [Flavobacterium salilacus subsp. salilacus]|uniref:DUF4175 family protein n=1 Tax=Flavobacterium TaxID=237 RepID=UPI001074EA52|nr:MULTISPECIES: DUF4175 family protein [Flavobacterium]KAF2519020.1 hypothetical protein E0W68_07110 [Flavobacterium salilacus subsp. salilacus]MBE1614817.1 hypothetical protein [Flavobacterium sp. SaA2.13]
METKNSIYQKLEGFIKKYYTNELIRGSIFFVGLGLLYFIVTLLVEYFLWLPQGGRTALFWVFIGVEAFLLLRFILFPLFKLFKLQKGIDYNQASAIIGNHFAEVSDKLTNFLQLSGQSHQSELLAASIEQKANNLQPVPFANAVNFKKNLKYVPYAAVPLLLILFFMISGNSGVITQSFDRVVHYDKHYAPPAPFEFVVLNKNLTAQQDTDFLLEVKTQGSVIPENAMITIGEENYYLENVGNGVFQYKFEKPSKNIDFQLKANTVVSQPYALNVVAVPTIANFEMVLNYPAYLRKAAEVVRGTGNAVVPEGTKVTWKVEALATTGIEWVSGESTSAFNRSENGFNLSKSIFNNTDYQILTSNKSVKHHEKLQYQITTIKDQHPTITVGTAPDSLQLKQEVLVGQVSDDYGLTKLQIVYYPQDNPDAARKYNLSVQKDTYDRFVYTFPEGLNIKAGVNYEYYFEVFDNDAVHNYKSTKSSVFSHRELTDDEKQEQVLQEQNSNINSLEKSIKNQDKQISELDKLRKMNKEKFELDFKDQKKIEDFINRQKQQEDMMKEFSKKLEDNLEQFNPEKKDEFKEELMKRLEKTEAEAEKNKKLLDELKKLTDKINKEELAEKIDQFKQKAKNQTKNLEQLVELTKRFYVEKKAEQIADKLQKLGEKQEQLSESKENSAQKQDDINKEFDKLQEEMRELEKQNEELKKPMDIPTDKNEEQDIEKDMEKAQDELQKQNKDAAKPKQKSAGKKMKQMGGQMMQMMMSGEMEMMQEDVKMLRQILDNLLAYSFSQEDVMGQFKNTDSRSASFSKYLITQQDLKQQFRHVDDSIFAFSLRNPKVTEVVTAEVGNVHYYVDKALADLADNQVPRGVSNQQYAVTSANKLADMLSDMLNSMQMQMQMQGQGMGKPSPGQGEGMQLPDIIQKQEGLSEKMKKGMKKGEQEGEGKPGEKGKPNSSGEGGEGEGEGQTEGNAGKLLEIYKEQQQLREALQKALEKEGMGGNGQNAMRQMKEIEKQLLNKGFNNETMKRMQSLKHELLKLDKAIQQQGEENKRQSQTNKKEFNNQANQLPDALKEYLNSVEILNRQSLPLRPNFNQKVQTYFRKDD